MRRTRPIEGTTASSAGRHSAAPGEGAQPPGVAVPSPGARGARARTLRRRGAGLAGVVLVALTLGLSVVAVCSASHAAALRDRGVQAEAQVESVSEGWLWSADVRFALSSGDTRSATIGRQGWVSRPQPGTSVVVRYDPRDPSHTVMDARRAPSFVAAGWAAAMALACAFAAWAAFVGGLRPRRRRRSA